MQVQAGQKVLVRGTVTKVDGDTVTVQILKHKIKGAVAPVTQSADDHSDTTPILDFVDGN